MAVNELGNTCSHGARWDEECKECDLVWAKQFEAHWGDLVDKSRAIIAEAEGEKREGK